MTSRSWTIRPTLPAAVRFRLWSVETCSSRYPVDLDLMMLDAYPDAYKVQSTPPEESTIIAVLGKSHVNEDRLGNDLLDLFDDYHAKFDLKSKPATHLTALSTLTDEALLEALPDVLGRLVERVKAKLAELPE